MTDAEIQAEADRLMSLDETGREREAIVIALRLGRQSEKASQELLALDYAFLNEFARVEPDRETPDGERLDA